MKLSSLRRGLAALFCLAGLAGPAAAETVRIGGTGAALGTIERLAAELKKRQPDFAYEVIPNLGSDGGLKALARGAVQVAVMSRPFRPQERSDDFVATEYGRTPFVVATAKPGVAGLSRAQLAEFLANRQARWPDGSPVRLVLRPASDIDAGLLASFSPEVKAALQQAMAREGMVVAASDRECADAIERLPGALGPSSLALLLSERRRLKPLAIDGVQPTVRAVEDGSYPYYKTNSIVVRRNASPMTERFLAFLASDEGRRILTDTGHALPARRN